MNKQNVAYPYNAIVLSHIKERSAGTGYNVCDPEGIMLSERNQMPKTTCCVIPFIRKAQSRQIHREQEVDEWLPKDGKRKE
jgi:hypothetical protein